MTTHPLNCPCLRNFLEFYTYHPSCRPVHHKGCSCSVCWAHHFADALKFMPYTKAELTPFTDYLTYYDYTKQFAIENSHTNRVGFDD